jgi:hypothetical protein
VAEKMDIPKSPSILATPKKGTVCQNTKPKKNYTPAIKVASAWNKNLPAVII